MPAEPSRHPLELLSSILFNYEDSDYQDQFPLPASINNGAPLTALTFRPYQKEAVKATVEHLRRHSTPALIILPTSAGRSLVIAKLMPQNAQKYRTMGLDAAIFVAGLKLRDRAGKVVFGGVQSGARNLATFTTPFSLLIIDECHLLGDDDSQYQQVICHMRKVNPGRCVLNLTATPYQLRKGWIYHFQYHGKVGDDEHCFFRDCIFELPLHYMANHGYLVAPEQLDIPVRHYDFSRLSPNALSDYLAVDSTANFRVSAETPAYASLMPSARIACVTWQCVSAHHRFRCTALCCTRRNR